MSLAESDGIHFPLEAVEGWAADYWPGNAVPYSDDVWEERLLVLPRVLAYGARKFILWPLTDMVGISGFRWLAGMSTTV